jgi:type I pantothenate kinase
MQTTYSQYLLFDRSTWRDFRRNMPFTLTEEDILKLHGKYEAVSLQEVVEIYLPLSRLLNLYVTAAQELFHVTAQFLGHPEPKVPYIIGIAGSVAVGKSTTSRVLQALLSCWESHPRVEIVTTDGFLYSNTVLETRGLLNRKGFPESYDLKKLVRFLSALKAGENGLEVPIYSHQFYDITNEVQVINQPDIVILEGLNLLQNYTPTDRGKRLVFVTDYIDFSIYVDAKTTVIRKWYLDRFMKFRRLAKENPLFYLYQFTKMADHEALEYADQIWQGINELNLEENILPYKDRAKLILSKGEDHAVQAVYLRKI